MSDTNWITFVPSYFTRNLQTRRANPAKWCRLPVINLQANYTFMWQNGINNVLISGISCLLICVVSDQRRNVRIFFLLWEHPDGWNIWAWNVREENIRRERNVCGECPRGNVQEKTYVGERQNFNPTSINGICFFIPFSVVQCYIFYNRFLYTALIFRDTCQAMQVVDVIAMRANQTDKDSADEVNFCRYNRCIVIIVIIHWLNVDFICRLRHRTDRRDQYGNGPQPNIGNFVTSIGGILQLRMHQRPIHETGAQWMDQSQDIATE